MTLTIRQRIGNWVSDRKDELDILRRKDFSWRFKLATILTNGQLRIDTGSILYHLNNARTRIKDGSSVELVLWHLDRASKAAEDIWVI